MCALCFIHNYDLSWAFWNTSSASTTPWLNTNEFLCSHKHQTIAAHTPFHTKFCLLLLWIKWKLSKWVIKSLCWTNRIPIHLKHKAHTHRAYLHSRKRCWHDSSLDWHRAHIVVFNITHLLLKHSLVGTLPNSTLQVVITTLGNALIFHRYLKASIYGPLSGLSRRSYAEVTVKHPDSSPFHTWVSFPSFIMVTLEICISSSISIGISHWNLSRLHLKVHLHTDSSRTPTSSTFWP